MRIGGVNNILEKCLTKEHHSIEVALGSWLHFAYLLIAVWWIDNVGCMN
jgi:hypothetical protein